MSTDYQKARRIIEMLVEHANCDHDKKLNIIAIEMLDVACGPEAVSDNLFSGIPTAPVTVTGHQPF